MFTSALKSFTSNISANYTISPTPTSVAGAWKVYDGKKKTTGKNISVFVFERKSLDPQTGGLGVRSGGPSLRKLQDEVIERLKKEANSLARLRHPSVLELAEPVEDTRNGGLIFATEPVTASLAGLLQEKDNQEKAGGVGGRPSRYVVEEADGHKRRRELEIDELEIQKGLLQIAQGLEFLHESAGLVHGHLTPDAVYINTKSDWKIAGLGFSGPPDASNGQSTMHPIPLSEVLYHDPRLPRAVQFNLDYTSPDFVIDGNVSSSADMFSLGLLILALYNSPHSSPLKTNSNSSMYKKLFASSSSIPSSTNNFLSSRPLPKDLVSDVLPRLMSRKPAQRMNVREFQQSQFFDNILVSTIRFLDALPAKNSNEKSQFMRGLPRILEQFPKSVLDKKVLPALLEETKDRDLLSLILQNVFKIITLLPSGKRAFTDKVNPRLREIFLGAGAKSNSIDRDTAKEAGLVVVLDNMGMIAEHCSSKDFKDDIFPLVQLSLESPTHSLVDKALGYLPTILSVLDFSTIKHELFPVVAAVFSKTSSLGIKVRGLEAFVVLCGGASNDEAGDGLDGVRIASKGSKPISIAVLDKYTMQEKIIPLLKAIKTKEPAVIMAALAVIKQVGKVADTGFLAMDVLPLLWSFGLGPLLNLDQFQEFMHLIKTLSAKIEQEQTRKLQELSSSSGNGFDSFRSNDLMNIGSANGMFGSNGGGNVGEDDFERLVLGKRSGTGADILGANPKAQPQRAQPTQANAPAFSWSTPSTTPSTTPGQIHTSNPSGISAPRQSSNSRAVTPDQALSGFAALQPSSSGTSSHIKGNGRSSVPPIQPSLLLNQTQHVPVAHSTLSIFPPPLNSASSLHLQQTLKPSLFQAYAAAPAPIRDQRANAPTQYGAGLGGGGGRGRGGSSSMASNDVQKKGLDAYESLL